MPAIPQSEVLAKFFEEIGEKCGEFWRNVSQIFVLQFPGKMAAKYFTKILDIFHGAPNSVFFTVQIWGPRGPTFGGPEDWIAAWQYCWQCIPRRPSGFSELHSVCIEGHPRFSQTSFPRCSFVDPEALQSGYGLNCYFWSGDFKKIAGEFLSGFFQHFFFLQTFRPCFLSRIFSQAA